MTLENPTTCAVCGNTYPYRKGKMYCSSRCKQKSHLNNRNGIPLEQPKEQLTKPTYDFSYDEYERLREKGFDEEPILYFFLRRSFRKDADLDTLYDYLNSFYKEDEAYFKLTGSKAYETFRHEFLGGRYTVG